MNQKTFFFIFLGGEIYKLRTCVSTKLIPTKGYN